MYLGVFLCLSIIYWLSKLKVNILLIKKQYKQNNRRQQILNETLGNSKMSSVRISGTSLMHGLEQKQFVYTSE